MSDTRKDTNEHANKEAAVTAKVIGANVQDATAANQQAGRHSAEKAAEVARVATREAAVVAQQAARSVEETMRTSTEAASRLAERSSERFAEVLARSDRNADEVAKASEHAVRAGAEAARRGTETAHQVAQSGLHMVTEATQRSVDQFSRAFGFSGDNVDEVTRASSRNLQAVTDSGAVLARGLQDISREWMSFAQDRLRQNFEGLNRLANCRSLQDVVQVQSDLVRSGLEDTINGARSIAQLSVRVAEEAGQKIAVRGNTLTIDADRTRQGQTRQVA